ncbi:hypothetical protein Gotri_028062 [Gossypium trilobum]|uniref:Uncharacterized protein n=1 Tax=Gossypium trilobum TaxID=34281 RepID=A0A7J9FMP2_9ROSI|nr:hypothetical protein [Gossypium trilobum]
MSVEEDDDDSNLDMEEFSDEFTNEEFDCIDLGHDFYVVKFLSAEDLLTVGRFHPTMGTIASIAVWIQLLGIFQ